MPPCPRRVEIDMRVDLWPARGISGVLGDKHILASSSGPKTAHRRRGKPLTAAPLFRLVRDREAQHARAKVAAV